VLSKRSQPWPELMLCKSYELRFEKFAEFPDNVNPLAWRECKGKGSAG